MLPFIVAVVAVGAVGYMLSDTQESKKQNYRKKLASREDRYERKLEKQYQYNQNKKRSILFQEIKHEQSKLKEEKRELAKIRNTLQRGTEEHTKVIHQIVHLTQMIEKKQQDADRVRG